ncbi:MAG TPA: hypothetical protein VFU48_04695, partial [Nitrospira sp.]|nr:hypothetical protein [Nitrospira sp.]
LGSLPRAVVRLADAIAAPVGSADQKRNITHQCLHVTAILSQQVAFLRASPMLESGRSDMLGA